MINIVRSMRLTLTRTIAAVAVAMASLGACANGTSASDVTPPGSDGAAAGEAGMDAGDLLGDAPPPVNDAMPPEASADTSTDTTTGSDSAAAALPTQGEILITEVMYKPAGPQPAEEWFEVYNTTGDPKLLSGLVLQDSAMRSHTILASPAVVIAPRAYMLMVRSRATVSAAPVNLPGAAAAYEYASIVLTNGSTGTIVLLNGATTIAQAPYGPFFPALVSGDSVQLKTLTYAASGMAAAWCESASAWTGGNGKGTPGAAGDCP